MIAGVRNTVKGIVETLASSKSQTLTFSKSQTLAFQSRVLSACHARVEDCRLSENRRLSP